MLLNDVNPEDTEQPARKLCKLHRTTLNIDAARRQSCFNVNVLPFFSEARRDPTHCCRSERVTGPGLFDQGRGCRPGVRGSGARSGRSMGREGMGARIMAPQRALKAEQNRIFVGKDDAI